MTTTVTATLVPVTCSGCGIPYGERGGTKAIFELGDRHTYITLGCAKVIYAPKFMRVSEGIVEVVCRQCSARTTIDLRGA